MDGLNLNEARTIEVIKGWERATGNTILSDAAKLSGKLTIGDADVALRALAETQPGAEGLVSAAAKASKSGGSKLSKQITDKV